VIEMVGTLLPLISKEFALEVLGFSLGLLFGNAFKDVDHQVQQTPWFKSLTPFQQWILQRILDAMHHFQYGLVLIVLAECFLQGSLLYILVYAMGVGLVVDDLPDIPARYRDFFRGWTP